MPVSPAVRRMNGKWPAIIERCRLIAADIPADGVSPSDFVSVALDDLDEDMIETVLGLLHRRGIVWVGKRQGEVRVYGSRPKAPGVKAGRITTTATARLLAAVSPHVGWLTMASQAMTVTRSAEDWQANAQATEDARVSCIRVLSLCYAHHARGVGLQDMREAMWNTFNTDAMHALVFHDPRLQRESKHTELSKDILKKPRRMSRGLGLEAKVLDLVVKSDTRGLSRSGIAQKIRPKPNVIDVETILIKLMIKGDVYTTSEDEDRPGVPGRRYFSKQLRPPA